ncbi:hypothetical protein D3Z50_14520 [Clostridiaceae bacterium]|nr:hypothetical protein [Clostridiaceae bacterium]
MRNFRNYTLFIMTALFLSGCAQKAGSAEEQQTVREEETNRHAKDGAESETPPGSPPDHQAFLSEPEPLRRLYIDFPQTASYQEAIAFIQASGLPYSEKKENGGRLIKIAENKADAAIETPAARTFQEYDYIEIYYMYPKQEPDGPDDLKPYVFTGILYISAEGQYQLSSHAESVFITKDAEVIDSQMNRQEQIEFLENHAGDSRAD